MTAKRSPSHNSKRRSRTTKPDKNAIRNWNLYHVETTDGTHYQGITTYKDATRRIKQHGGEHGAKSMEGKTIKRVIEIRLLGRMKRVTAEDKKMMLLSNYVTNTAIVE